MIEMTKDKRYETENADNSKVLRLTAYEDFFKLPTQPWLFICKWVVFHPALMRDSSKLSKAIFDSKSLLIWFEWLDL